MGVSPVQAAAPPLVTPTSAPLSDQSHSFLDNAIALFDHFRAWNCSDETAPSAVWSRWRSPEQSKCGQCESTHSSRMFDSGAFEQALRKRAADMIFPTGRQVALRITLLEPMMIGFDRDDAAQSRGGASSARCRR
jgi:hypothetical protein